MRSFWASVAPLEFIFGGIHNRVGYGRPLCLLQAQSRKADPSSARVVEPFYAVALSRRARSVDIRDDDNAAKCVVCRWDATDVPTLKLIHRPEDA
jgi:hypothetical protein